MGYRAIIESKVWSDRDLRLLKAVSDQKRRELRDSKK
jgi:hypothetical protein